MSRLILGLVLFGLCGGVPADVALQCPAFRAHIGADARWQSLCAADGRELLAPEGPRAVATIRQGGRSFDASAADLTGADLSVRFTGTDTILRYQVQPAAGWIVLKLTAVEGARPEQITLLQVPVGITAHLGRMMGCAWDERTALGEVLLSRSPSSPSAPRDWYAQYTVHIPHAGRWAIWARVRYPSGSDDSFFLAPAGDSAALGTAQTLGNCGATGRKWHWTGQGSGTAAAPPGTAIVFSLPKGPFTFRIYPREAAGTAELSPRLDALCLCDDPDEVPTDAQARAAAASRPAQL